MNHKDGNKTNNRVDNLEWCDRSYNMKHAYDNNLLKCRPVYQYDKNGKLIKKWKGSKYAMLELNIWNANIVNCCQGRRKTAGGYIWKYINERGDE